MVRFTSAQYKSLRVADAGDDGVKFVDGSFETDDEAIIERLRGLAALGVTEADGAEPERESATGDDEPTDDENDPGSDDEPAGEPGAEPASNASRGTWAKYAESIGIEPGEKTKQQLRDEIAAKQG